MAVEDKKISEVFSFMQAFQEFLQEYAEEPVVFTPEAQVSLPLRPCLVIFSSDVHFGSIYTNYKKLAEIWQAVVDTEGVYLVVNGDFIDNFEVPVPKLLLAGINSQLISPQRQRYFYEQYLKALIEKGKLLGMVLGNHEEFSSVELFKEVSQKVPVAPNRIELTLSFENGFEVVMALIHKSRFNSFLNPTHSSLRELYLNHPYADIIVTSHTHLPSLMLYPYPKHRQGLTERVLIKTGSLKDLEPYTHKYFNPHRVSHISTPAVIIDPQKKRLLPFSRFEDALEVFKTIKTIYTGGSQNEQD